MFSGDILTVDVFSMLFLLLRNSISCFRVHFVDLYGVRLNFIKATRPRSNLESLEGFNLSESPN